MKGILLAGGHGSRLYPLTTMLSKHLLPVYDKPMIYYPLTTLMGAGIRDFLLISTPQHLPLYQQQLKDGEQWGISIQYAEQPQANGIVEAFIIGEQFIGNDQVCLILGDNIFYGEGLNEILQTVSKDNNGATIFAHPVKHPQAYGVIVFDDEMNPTEIVEKPKTPCSNFAVSGLYFYDNTVVEHAKTLKPSARGEKEITDMNKIYLSEQQLSVYCFHRGIAWLDMGTHRSLLDAANFIQTLEERQGLKIGCPEEVAWDMGYINDDKLQEQAESMRASGYGDYLLSLLATKTPS